MKEFYIPYDGLKLHAKLDMPENAPEKEARCRRFWFRNSTAAAENRKRARKP